MTHLVAFVIVLRIVLIDYLLFREDKFPAALGSAPPAGTRDRDNSLADLFHSEFFPPFLGREKHKLRLWYIELSGSQESVMPRNLLATHRQARSGKIEGQRSHPYIPEKHGIIHPLRHKGTLILNLFLDLLQSVLLGDGEIPQPTWQWLVIRISDALWHRACTRRL